VENIITTFYALLIPENLYIQKLYQQVNFMNTLKRFFYFNCILIFLNISLYSQQSEIQTPSQFLGFEIGADYKLADYNQIRSYFQMLANSSGRIEIETLGKTTLGNDMFMAIISSEENLRKKSEYQQIARKLADPRGLSQTEVENLIKQGKVIVLVTCNIHASEIGATQMAMEWAYALVTAKDSETRRRLENVILLLVPSLNPDGQLMEVEWYRKYVGTKYEGGRMPWLYHYYIGHDNNRDWFMLTQKESKAMNKAVYHEWYPQVWLDEHQMGSSGPRMFVPPYANPVAANVHPLIWRSVDNIGTMMSLRLEEQNKSGVIYGWVFDAYWPGGTKNTAWWKNVVGLLTEVASTKMGSPVEVDPIELRGGGKGLVEYRQQINFPNPWTGGKWRLRDIIDYERIASDALLEVCTNYREDFLRNISKMALDAVKLGEEDLYYKIPLDQRDSPMASKLAHLIRENGAEVFYSQSEKSFYIPTAQPFARFLNEFLGTQSYPEIKPVYGSEIIRPYDVTAWSLPLMMGVTVEKVRITKEVKSLLKPISDDDKPKGIIKNSGAPMYLVSNNLNNSLKLVNEAFRNKSKIYYIQKDFEVDNVIYPTGTFAIGAYPGIEKSAEDLGINIQGVSGINIPKVELKEPRVGLYKPWLASMDEGWTRWIFDQYGFSYKNIDNAMMKTAKLSGNFDVIIIPALSKDVIIDGKWKPREGQMKYFTELPPEYAGGIGQEGVKNIKEFVEKGGTLIALSEACNFVIDQFNIPVSNVLINEQNDISPGSLLRVYVDTNHPVTYGMPEIISAFVGENIAFQTTIPGSELSRKVLASYPDNPKEILQSGWILDPNKFTRRAAAVAVTYERGRIVLLGFNVQFRAQTESTFKLLFNSILWGGVH